MNTKQLNIGALIGSVVIFLAAFLASAVNGPLGVSAIGAGGIWYLLPLAGLSGIIVSALALGGKVNIKIPSLVIGGIVLLIAWLLGEHGKSALYQFVVMRADISKGFNSSFFTGRPLDTSGIRHSSFGLGFYLDILASLWLVAIGVLSRGRSSNPAMQHVA